jgi:hypothetical protein
MTKRDLNEDEIDFSNFFNLSEINSNLDETIKLNELTQINRNSSKFSNFNMNDLVVLPPTQVQLAEESGPSRQSLQGIRGIVTKITIKIETINKFDEIFELLNYYKNSNNNRGEFLTSYSSFMGGVLGNQNLSGIIQIPSYPPGVVVQDSGETVSTELPLRAGSGGSLGEELDKYEIFYEKNCENEENIYKNLNFEFFDFLRFHEFSKNLNLFSNFPFLNSILLKPKISIKLNSNFKFVQIENLFHPISIIDAFLNSLHQSDRGLIDATVTLSPEYFGHSKINSIRIVK